MYLWTGSALVEVIAFACSALSHYLKHCWLIANWVPKDKLWWNFDKNETFIEQSVLKNVTWNMSSTLSTKEQYHSFLIFITRDDLMTFITRDDIDRTHYATCDVWAERHNFRNFYFHFMQDRGSVFNIDAYLEISQWVCNQHIMYKWELCIESYISGLSFCLIGINQSKYKRNLPHVNCRNAYRIHWMVLKPTQVLFFMATWESNHSQSRISDV